jgi:hypothetical protein
MWIVFPAVAAVVALVVLVWFVRSEAGRPRRKGMMITAGVAALLALGGIALLGIPGAAVYGVSAPVVQLILRPRFHSLNEDVWPAAILITLTWPASLVLAYAIANGPLRRRGRGARWAALVLVPYAAGVALTLWAHLSM